MRVPAAGGKPVPVTRLEGDEKSHRWPRFLPGSRHFLYEVRKPVPGAGAAALSSRLIYLASLDGKEKRLVLSEGTSVAYVAPGYLLFGRAKNLMAVACDPNTLELRGEPVVLASGIEGFTAPGAPFFSASERLLVFAQNAGARTTRMVWYDRSGNELSMVGPTGDYLSVGMAPDGRTVVASRAEDPLPPDLWLFDTGVGRGIRLTRDNVPQLAPVVAPGGVRIFFSSFARGPWDIWTTTPKGMPDLKPFLESGTPKAAKDISPDGRFLLYREFNVGTLGDLKVASLEGEPAPRTFVGTADDETNGDFAPDGRSVAYVSDESGRQEVYVASFPEATRRLRVTSEGGSQPRWSRDGKELFYIHAGHLIAVPVTGGGDALAFGQGKALFALSLFVYGDTGFDVATRYDVAPDGRFLALVRTREESAEPLAVVQNWEETMKKKP
jgi:dipeptidyl aminopeptidase/acylaminoacyl peptidase